MTEQAMGCVAGGGHGASPNMRGTVASPDTGGSGADEAAAAQALAAAWRPENAEREQLVERYAHLVKYVVGRLGVGVPGVFDHEDAMQAGAIGLLNAIDAYRPEAAASFESYALLRIRGAILDAVRAIDTVGRAGREAARAIERAMSELYASLGRTPEEWEVANRLGMPLERYQERLQAASVVTVSLDSPDDHDGGAESMALADTISDDGAPDPVDWVERRDDVARLATAIGGLGERQKLVLALYYQDELTLREIGEVLGVTESRVCQIHAETLLALRARLGGTSSGPGHAVRGRRRGGPHPRSTAPTGGASRARQSAARPAPWAADWQRPGSWPPSAPPSSTSWPGSSSGTGGWQA